MHRFILVLLTSVIGIVGLGTSQLRGEKIYVGRSVPAGSRVSIDRIAHRGWDALLKRYVDHDGNVNYAAWKRSTDDRRALQAYLALLSRADSTKPADRAAVLAYWINAYNAVTIEGILRLYPTTSIRNHTAKFFGYNIWKELLLRVGGRTYSLERIEHEVLRKMGEPRIHFALVCASRSCPPLRAEAYTSELLAGQLAANAKTFFANRGNFRYDSGSGTFRLSSIMKWYATDFGTDTAGQLRAIAPYLPGGSAATAARRGQGRIAYLDYDWDLNDQATAR
jgi:hypothetical protein